MPGRLVSWKQLPTNVSGLRAHVRVFRFAQAPLVFGTTQQYLIYRARGAGHSSLRSVKGARPPQLSVLRPHGLAGQKFHPSTANYLPPFRVLKQLERWLRSNHRAGRPVASVVRGGPEGPPDPRGGVGGSVLPPTKTSYFCGNKNNVTPAAGFSLRRCGLLRSPFSWAAGPTQQRYRVPQAPLYKLRVNFYLCAGAHKN